MRAIRNTQLYYVAIRAQKLDPVYEDLTKIVTN